MRYAQERHFAAIAKTRKYCPAKNSKKLFPMSREAIPPLNVEIRKRYFPRCRDAVGRPPGSGDHVDRVTRLRSRSKVRVLGLGVLFSVNQVLTGSASNRCDDSMACGTGHAQPCDNLLVTKSHGVA